jgi:hypothetical protein
MTTIRLHSKEIAALYLPNRIGMLQVAEVGVEPWTEDCPLVRVEVNGVRLELDPDDARRIGLAMVDTAQEAMATFGDEDDEEG